LCCFCSTRPFGRNRRRSAVRFLHFVNRPPQHPCKLTLSLKSGWSGFLFGHRLFFFSSIGWICPSLAAYNRSPAIRRGGDLPQCIDCPFWFFLLLFFAGFLFTESSRDFWTRGSLTAPQGFLPKSVRALLPVLCPFRRSLRAPRPCSMHLEFGPSGLLAFFFAAIFDSAPPREIFLSFAQTLFLSGWPCVFCFISRLMVPLAPDSSERFLLRTIDPFLSFRPLALRAPPPFHGASWLFFVPAFGTLAESLYSPCNNFCPFSLFRKMYSRTGLIASRNCASIEIWITDRPFRASNPPLIRCNIFHPAFELPLDVEFILRSKE